MKKETNKKENDGANGDNNNNKDDDEGEVSFYEDENNLRKLCDFVRGKHGPPVREGTMMDKRVHYIKGALTATTIYYYDFVPLLVATAND